MILGSTGVYVEAIHVLISGKYYNFLYDATALLYDATALLYDVSPCLYDATALPGRLILHSLRTPAEQLFGAGALFSWDDTIQFR
jgi:hypothetical protein